MKLSIFLKISILTVLGLCSGSQVKACSCAGTSPADFFASLNYNNGIGFRPGSYTFYGELVGLTSNGDGVRLKVFRQYHGPKNRVGDTVTILAGNGADCNVSLIYAYTSHIYDSVIITLKEVLPMLIPQQDSFEYTLFICSTNNVLKVHNDSVFGGYVGTFAYNGYPFLAFEDSLRNVMLAHPLSTPVILTPNIAVQVYPNPVGEQLVLSATTGAITDIELRNSVGQRVYQRSLNESNTTISTKELPPGLYILYLKLDNGQLWSEKIIRR